MILWFKSCKMLRDRVALLNYRLKFKEDSPDYIKASILIKDNKVSLHKQSLKIVKTLSSNFLF